MRLVLTGYGNQIAIERAHYRGLPTCQLLVVVVLPEGQRNSAVPANLGTHVAFAGVPLHLTARERL